MPIQPVSGALKQYAAELSVVRGERAHSDYRTLTRGGKKKTSRAPGVQSLNGSVEGNLAQKRRKESVWTFPRGQHWHFPKTNFAAFVDSMLGAARLKE